jgi:hypothetical protein
MMQMKIVGIPYGGLKYAEAGVSSLVTALELRQDPGIEEWMERHPRSIVPDILISNAIFRTSTGRYISTVLTQSGHHIDKIVVTDTEMGGIYDFPDDNFEDDQYVRLLRKGLNNFDEMPVSFRLHFTLSPLQK